MRGIWTPLPWWRSLDAHHKTAYSTLALALVTLPLAAATVLLAFLNRAILNEMRAGERPIVWLSNVRSQPFFVPATVPSDKGRIFWDFGWTNFGKSPAVEVQFTRTILTGIESFKMPPLASGAPIAPTQYDQTRANSQSDLSQTDFETLMRTNDAIKVVGQIIYSDVYGTTYESTFCFAWAYDGVGYCNYYGYGNHVR